MKRIFDFLASLAGLAVLSPVFVAIALLIAVKRDGPVIFAQKRVGKNRALFTCYKFRTMATTAPQAATHEVSASHITDLGIILRRFKLDELPQLWNVLWGEMSLVGPRPCLPSQTDLIAARDALGVYDLLPGITGLAQTQGVDMSDPERLAKIDADYAWNRNFAGDLKLIMRTIFPALAA